MNVRAQQRLWKDIAAVESKSVKRQILHFIDEAAISSLVELLAAYDFKPLRNQTTFYRLRIENYRLGCRYDRATDSLLLMRLLHRSVIYQSFP